MRTAFVACALLVAACGIDDPAEVDDTARIALNGLAAADLLANEGQIAPLASQPFAAAAAASPMRSTVSGKRVLTYLAACALPAGQSVKVGTDTYTGTYGLVPSWATSALTASQQRWVSACMLARTNLYGVQVEMSMRGANPALAPALLEPVDYLVPEGAFYGNLFSANPVAYACTSFLKTATNYDSARACSMSSDGVSTKCGFTYEHGCALLDLDLAPACSGLLPPYGNCRGDGTTYSEVVTVFLKVL